MYLVQLRLDQGIAIHSDGRILSGGLVSLRQKVVLTCDCRRTDRCKLRSLPQTGEVGVRIQGRIGTIVWTQTVLHNFTGTDGGTPYGGLVMDTNGNLYGTTVAGGAGGACSAGCGVVRDHTLSDAWQKRSPAILNGLPAHRLFCDWESVRSALFPAFTLCNTCFHHLLHQSGRRRLVNRKADGPFGCWTPLEFLLEPLNHGRPRKEAAMVGKCGVPYQHPVVTKRWNPIADDFGRLRRQSGPNHRPHLC